MNTDERVNGIHEKFEAHAIQSPQAIAITYEGMDLTYAEINERSNRLAYRLRSLGISQDTIVGLCAERSPEMVIGILGILKAGGAYLPIDPNYPQQRQSYLLADSKAPVLLTQRHLTERFTCYGGRVELLDEADAFSAQIGNLKVKTRSESLAYVIYTSGSTGHPKGVLVTHGNIARLFEATDPWFRFDNQDTWTLFHSISFDFSVWELWGALAHGGRLVIVPYLVSRSPEDFYQLLRSEKVTILNQTPSAFRQLIRADEALGGIAEGLALRFIIFGGEALQLQSLKAWFDRHSDQNPILVNMYGITETTVHVTYRPLSIADLGNGTSRSPIGRPIPDLQVHLLDENLQPVPDGHPGEMFIGGAGVSRGYLNQPNLTASRFIVDPFDDRLDARLYRSGDIARRLPDGELDFLGRADDQIKIRGFRIELGEIESALARYPEIRESAVISRKDGTGQNRLIAYIAGRDNVTIDPQMLRKRLGEELPDYMTPSTVILMDALPLNANGKVDCSLLPVPQVLEQLAGDSSKSEGIESQVAAIWSSILGNEVGTDDNFFDLGGNSIDLVEAHLRLRERFGRDLLLIDMLAYPTVRSLARRLSGQLAIESGLDRDRHRARNQRGAVTWRRLTWETRS